MNKRDERKLKNGGDLTAEQFGYMKRIFYNSCTKCGKKQSYLAADHIIPVSKGGPTTWENIQPLCRSCNSKKGDRESIDYRLGFLARAEDRPHKFFTSVRFYISANYQKNEATFKKDCISFFRMLGASPSEMMVLNEEIEGL